MPRVEFNCAKCDKKLLKWKSQIPKSGIGFCSASCSTSYRNKYQYNPSKHRDISGEKNPMFGKGYKIRGEKNGMFGIKGEENPNWKGGRYIRKDGYVRVNTPNGRVLEHRYLLEQHGINLDGLIVHHKNGNPSDNRLDNFEIMSQSEHINLHREQRDL